MRNCLALFCTALLGVNTGFSQPSIDSTDMPFPHDTVTRTEIGSFSGLNYTASGSNHLWNFTNLDGTDKRIDTFITVNSTPISYIAAFSNPFDQEHRATVAEKQPASPSPPGITIEDIYGFFKADSTYYGQVGFGARINGIPIPILFSDADVMYRFPMTMGQNDTSVSDYELNVPSFGYFREQRTRITLVDGWGTLYLPADTLDVMRLKSISQIQDTMYMDSLGFGFNFNRSETEYKWLAKGYKLPVLEIVQRQGGGGGNNTDGWFLDNRPPSAGIGESKSDATTFTIYPNPAREHISISNPEPGSKATWSIYDLQGRLMASGEFCGDKQMTSLLNCTPGMYCIILTTGHHILHRSLVRQ